MKSTLTIQTPEGITFSFDLATPVTRSLAWAVDAAAIGTVTYFTGKLTQATGVWSPDWANALSLALYFALSIAYAIVLEWRWRGQTVGKRLLGLRVIDAQALQLRFTQIAVRNLIRAADMLPITYLVGGVIALLSSNGQRLGDLAANTVVIRERQTEEPDLEKIPPARYNSLLEHSNLAARLRSLTDPEAVAMAMRAVSQRDGFEPLARIQVFRDLADYFRALVPFPQSALEGLTDEQYVRSVLGVIYNPAGRRHQEGYRNSTRNNNAATSASTAAPPSTAE
jgi:uncharacterized RDD family membrane protein YckC